MPKKASKILKRLLIVGLAVYICLTYISQQGDLSRTEKELELIDSQIAQAQKESKSKEDEMKLLDEPEYIEHVARENLGYTKKSEKVFIDINK